MAQGRSSGRINAGFVRLYSLTGLDFAIRCLYRSHFRRQTPNRCRAVFFKLTGVRSRLKASGCF